MWMWIVGGEGNYWGDFLFEDVDVDGVYDWVYQFFGLVDVEFGCEFGVFVFLEFFVMCVFCCVCDVVFGFCGFGVVDVVF